MMRATGHKNSASFSTRRVSHDIGHWLMVALFAAAAFAASLLGMPRAAYGSDCHQDVQIEIQATPD